MWRLGSFQVLFQVSIYLRLITCVRTKCFNLNQYFCLFLLVCIFKCIFRGSPRHVQGFKARYLLKSAAGFSLKIKISEKFHYLSLIQLYCADMYVLWSILINIFKYASLPC